VLAGTRAAIAAATGASLLMLSACSHAAGPARVPAPVTMTYCGSGPQVRPSVLEIVCGTSEIAARSLTWSAWGKQIATGVGTAVVDLCTYEDCHTGSYGSAPIVVIASKIVRCTRGTQAYSKLQYVFVGGCAGRHEVLELHRRTRPLRPSRRSDHRPDLLKLGGVWRGTQYGPFGILGPRWRRALRCPR
jgi:hypothetical protein